MFGGLGILLLGGFVGFHAMFLCLLVPKLRRFAVAAFFVPFATSIVYLASIIIFVYVHERS